MNFRLTSFAGVRHILEHATTRSVWPHCMAGCLLALAATTAHAALNVTPYVDVRYEHNSNIFAFPDNDSLLPPGADTTKSDSLVTYSGGLDLEYLASRQRFFFNAAGRQVEYSHFDDLSHTEYTVGGGWAWAVGSSVDGNIDYSIERRMAPFTDRVSTVLTLEKDQLLSADMSVKITPVWSLEPRGHIRNVDSPQPGFPDFSLRENAGGLALKYAGLGRFKFGIDAERLSGSFKGGPGNLDFTQTTEQLTADYSVSQLSAFNAALGYTTRTQPDLAGDVSAVTGALGYRRQLTGKTSINLQVLRAVNSYVTTGTSQVDTSGSFGINWQATAKTAFALQAARTRSVFKGEALPTASSSGRVDNYTTAGFNTTYSARRWLTIQLFAQYQDRTSNIDLFGFDGLSVGIDVRAQLANNK